MPRRFIFPDPNDCSPNSPSYIVSSTQVLGIYNQNSEERMERVTKKVQEWFCQEAKRYGWDNAMFSGNQCMISVKMEKRKIPEE